jgi:hypothetical protein
MKFLVSLPRRLATMETGAKLACTRQVMLAAEQAAALEATRIRRLRHIPLHPEEHNLVHIKDHKPAARIVSAASHVKHRQRSVLIPRLSVKMPSKPGRT